MTRRALWTAIRDALQAEIAGGQYGPGDRLPTEAELSARFGVNRHTVRRALADLAERNIVRARRGAGVFVTAQPTTYALGPRVRFHQNLRAAGQVPGREMTFSGTRAADSAEAGALGLPPGAEVHVNEGISTADGAPLALFTSIYPARRFPGLLAALREHGSVTAAFREEGLADYVRASTEISAVRATATQALRLGLSDGDPLLQTVSINTDLAGHPVEYGRTWFSGDRVTLRLAEGEL